jgi:hypothetical protein
VSGTGVTLFFTKGGGATTYGQFVMTECTLKLSAPTDTTNNGVPTVLVFADRKWAHTGAQDFQVLSSTYSGDGIWYLTNAGIEFWSSGTFQGTNYFGVVADNLFTAGTILYPTNNYSNIPTGNPFLPAGGLVQ